MPKKEKGGSNVLRKVTFKKYGLVEEEGFELYKGEGLLYLIKKGQGKVIAVFLHNARPREIMRECSKYLREERIAGLI